MVNKKLLALCLALWLFVLCGLPALAAQFSYRDQLSTGEAQIYDTLKAGVTAKKADIAFTLPEAISGKDANTLNQQAANMAYRAFEALYRDAPEIFWVSKDGIGVKTSAQPQSGGNYTVDGGTVSITINDAASVEKKKQALEKEVAAILASATGSDYEKVKAFHKAIVDRCVYDDDAKNNPGKFPDAYESYGALVNKRAVCEGYAKSMKLLCDRAGIASVIVGGKAGSEDHMWNYVQLDGTYYLVDATFDDPSDATPSEEYLLKGSSTTAKSHRAQGGFIEGFNSRLNDPTLSKTDYQVGAALSPSATPKPGTSPTPTPSTTPKPTASTTPAPASLPNVEDATPDSDVPVLEDAELDPDTPRKAKKDSCKVTYSQTKGGEVTVRYVGDRAALDSGQTVIGGTALDISAQPAPGYRVAELRIQMGASQQSQRGKTSVYVRVLDDCVIDAVFEPVTK